MVHSEPLSREIGNGFRKASFSLNMSRTVTSEVRSGGFYFSMWMESRESLLGGRRGGEKEEGEGGGGGRRGEQWGGGPDM